ncbi:MAG: hypothetical protein H7Y27_02830, partial [Gemmatimonadaceae bacterium]|nr:hypothetical protein [Chitinophagaceae bacterium]
AAPWLENITVFGNGSLIESKVKAKAIINPFIDFFPEHSLTGQAEYIINTGINIAAFKKTFEATFTYNRTGDYINQLGSSIYVVNPIGGKPLLNVPHFITQARDIVDIGLKQSLLKNKVQLKFNISNLLAKPLIIYQDFNGDDKLTTAFRIDATFSGQGRVLSGEDNVSSITIGQRTFFFSIALTL